MTPLIPVDAELLLESVDLKELKRFDIIVFQEGESLMCHYVWHINNFFDQGNIITRNLKNGIYDIPFSIEKVKGRVENYKISKLLRCAILVGLK
jgi:hypothetical protein